MGFSPKMKMWYEEAYEEIALRNKPETMDLRYAIYPKRFYEAVNAIPKHKQYDFNFVGSYKIDKLTEERRKWVERFATTHFTENSYLQFTDKKTKQTHVPLGVFDFTLLKEGFVPKEHPRAERNWFDFNYFKILCSSNFTLCPGGDLNWSMRFYESLMCRSIPILPGHDCVRNEYEASLPYKYYVLGDELKYDPEWAEHNYALFEQFHTLKFR